LAVKAFKKAIRLDPRSPDAHRGLGDAYMRQSQYLKAVDSYSQAARLSTNDANIYLALSSMADACNAAGRYSEATEAYEEIIQRLNPDEALVCAWLGYTYKKLVLLRFSCCLRMPV